ncbi:MAG: carbamoyltransferase HypF [Bacteroidetes bacterium]|nr:carbamoyltransferase HypF [Bacteroidota bacterium]
MVRKQILIRGVVQGVGFRPFIWTLAKRHSVSGWVLNHSGGVTIEAEGKQARVQDFISAIRAEKPVHSYISRMDIRPVPVTGIAGFEIRESESDDPPGTFILPDLATCPDCLKELFDPADRRFRYPFLNCTHCGPRYSIIQRLPYDRPNTTMKQFRMCPDCRSEYDQPEDRRFHAQPTACPTCGPELDFRLTDGRISGRKEEALQLAESLLRDGKILAMKGLGGFQLLCDARQEETVKTLRKRKNREEKPLAVLVPDLAAARRIAEISEAEEALLISSEAPIVLLKQRKDSGLAPSLNPGNPYIGLILPYTPLHHLLMADLGIPLVCTSGNRSDDPICTNEEEAALKLGAVADGFLNHNREIQRYIDDSVVRVIREKPMMIRRARGYAPLPEGSHAGAGQPVLAVGAHLKNTVSVSDGNWICTSQHLGDLSTVSATLAFESAILDLCGIYQIKPEVILCDLHPDYFSTRHAFKSRLPVVQVQHHEAHIAGIRAEHGVTGEALGVAWDGTGIGRDQTVHGGEFFLSSPHQLLHTGQFLQFPLAGGDTAVRDARRSAFGLLTVALGDEKADEWILTHQFLPPAELKTFRSMVSKSVNTVQTSSAGRLFDGVSALMKIRSRSAYEGQAAMDLEFSSDGSVRESYPAEITGKKQVILDWRPVILAILEDLDQGKPISFIGGKFHFTLASLIIRLAKLKKLDQILAGGGCFQNKLLLETLIELGETAGIQVYWPQHIPPNDGGISFGQIAWYATAGKLQNREK